jgi:leucyl aminopeptidase
MFIRALLGACAVSAWLVHAIPATDRHQMHPDLRLIKTSESDLGTWVTEKEKIELYVSKRIGFIDITDITVSLFFNFCVERKIFWEVSGELLR